MKLKRDSSQKGRKKGADPNPRGAAFHDIVGPPDPLELDKLERTRALGGLCPERSEFLDDLCRRLGPLPL
jgi:hypothetical protein